MVGSVPGGFQAASRLSQSWLMRLEAPVASARNSYPRYYKGSVGVNWQADRLFREVEVGIQRRAAMGSWGGEERPCAGVQRRRRLAGAMVVGTCRSQCIVSSCRPTIWRTRPLLHAFSPYYTRPNLQFISAQSSLRKTPLSMQCQCGGHAS